MRKIPEVILAAAMSGRRFIPPVPSVGYYSIVNTLGATGGFAPDAITWNGLKAYTSCGASDFNDVPHALSLSSQSKKVRAEIKNTTHDRRAVDLPDTRRRSEVAFPDNRIPNGTSVWFALQVQPTAYEKPASMAATSGFGGEFFQFHDGSADSAYLTGRRAPNDTLVISTNGVGDTGQGQIRYSSAWTKGVPHDIVGQVTFDPTAGSVMLAIDGVVVVNLTGIPMGITTPVSGGYYLKCGAYHSAGIGADPLSSVVNEYANLVIPQAGSLASRIPAPPAWPAD